MNKRTRGDLTDEYIFGAENLILTADHKTVKLVDFGLAREESVTEMMTAETGTYRWMAPEVASELSFTFIFSDYCEASLKM